MITLYNKTNKSKTYVTVKSNLEWQTQENNLKQVKLLSNPTVNNPYITLR